MTINLSVVAFLTTILFAVLKLTGVLTWDWIWVLSPLWGYFLLLGAIVLLIGFIEIFILLMMVIIVAIDEMRNA